MRPVRIASILILLALVLGGCASRGKPMPDIVAEINATLDPTPARFLPGDILEVRFANDPSYNQTIRVDMNGNVGLLMVGTVNVAGKRPDQVRETLDAAYKSKLAAPDLSVNLVQLAPTSEFPANRNIHVLGEVRLPGSYPFVGQQVTIPGAIARAGGYLKATANLMNVLLVRWMPDKGDWKAWRIDANTDNWENSKQVLLQANDLIFVPNTPIDDVNIWIDQYIRLMIPFPYLIPTSLIFSNSTTSG
jgi:polysaccharide export outer membrane protein